MAPRLRGHNAGLARGQGSRTGSGRAPVRGRAREGAAGAARRLLRVDSQLCGLRTRAERERLRTHAACGGELPERPGRTDAGRSLTVPPPEVSESARDSHFCIHVSGARRDGVESVLHPEATCAWRSACAGPLLGLGNRKAPSCLEPNFLRLGSLCSPHLGLSARKSVS